MSQTELEIIKNLAIYSPFAVIVFICWKAGLLGALASRIKKNGDDKKITELIEFKELAESNHFHDLADLKNDMKDIKKQVNEIDKRLAVVESKLNK